ncbi:hypothetical protein [Thiopseudomonas denitrificans]|uniref:Uncharacterized protein n=1 Tax=Thiopseudomonas denitrificans TaxID=1501432 RepID=A0A4R6TWM5_9GAMM|nr:hypothetical protein [Thiopseudomonas denitrificans]TDQ38260.1 hypothetical protein DFQ45_105171 [Thiopseudomonas denitrificans]
MEIGKKAVILLFNLILHYFLFLFVLVVIVRVIGGVVCFYKVGFFCFGLDDLKKSLLAGLIGGGFVGFGSWLMTVLNPK